MKKEYKAPVLNVINVQVESLMINDSQTHSWDSGDAKKNGQGFVDDDADVTPAAPQKFWDDGE